MSSASTPILTDSEPPARLGRYEVLAKLASGGMASVFLGRIVGAGGFERVVAIKLCHRHLADDPAFRSMFLDEARLAARIHHPNVVATLDVSDVDALYLVMEYVEGGRISDLVAAEARRNSKVPISVALRVIVDALCGLHGAHHAIGPDGEPLRIVHRDVSPQNILVGADGVTRVVDFGIAKAEARSTVTSDGELKGKLAYMAPEQARSAGVTARSDLFAAAVVAWELLAGTRLFAGDSRADTLQRLLYAPIPRPSVHRPEIAGALERVILRGLSREPTERYADARAFAEALEGTGVPAATHREVSDYVGRTLAEPIAARRAALRGRSAGAAPLPAIEDGTDDAASGVLKTAGRRRSRRMVALMLAAAVLAVAIAIGVAVAVNAPPSDRGSSAVSAPAADRPRVPDAPRSQEAPTHAGRANAMEPIETPVERAAPRTKSRRVKARAAMRREPRGEFEPDLI